MCEAFQEALCMACDCVYVCVYVCVCVCVYVSRSAVLDSLRPHGLWPTRLLCPWDSPGKNTGLGCQFLLHAL